MSEDVIAKRSLNLLGQVRAWVARSEITFDQVFGFYPFRQEPNLLPLLEEMSSQCAVGLPVVREHSMDFYRWQPDDRLIVSSLGIHEPDTSTCDSLQPSPSTLILTPALAIDSKGYRLGYGGGFYDRYRARMKHGVYVGIVWENCLAEVLPVDSWDLPVHHVCTDGKP